MTTLEKHKRMPSGVRRMVANEALAAFAGEPIEWVREQFKPALGTYVNAIIGGLEERDRTCLNLYAAAMKLAGEEMNLALVLLERHGVKGEGGLEQLVNRQREAEGINEAQLWRLAEGFANDYRKRHGMPLLVEGRPVKEGT